MQGIYKTGEVIDVTYQATKATSGLIDVTMEIYDESRAKDGVNFPDVTMTEIGATGRYYDSLTPDAEGVWTVMIDSATKSGKIVKTFLVVGHNIDSIGDAIAALNDLSAADVNAEVDTALADYDGPTKAELDAAELAIRGADSDTLETLSDQLDDVSSPPMVG
uniref:Uncharacterized protein n=1 Tax=viral metagenome TaxID=1070528 RepID=A0A6M3L4L1_9ZZZZ